MIPLRDREGEIFVFVGTVKDMTLHPRQLSAAFIHVYQFTNKNTTLALVHKTQVEDVPYAMANFCGRLMAGVGNRLRIYDMGKKKLLRKCELKGLPTMIQSINVVSPSRIVVGDLAESFHFIKYNRQDNVMMVFADDVSPRCPHRSFTHLPLLSIRRMCVPTWQVAHCRGGTRREHPCWCRQVRQHLCLPPATRGVG